VAPAELQEPLSKSEYPTMVMLEAMISRQYGVLELPVAGLETLLELPLKYTAEFGKYTTPDGLKVVAPEKFVPVDEVLASTTPAIDCGLAAAASLAVGAEAVNVNCPAPPMPPVEMIVTPDPVTVVVCENEIAPLNKYSPG
jgi:hypothetical protein